MKLALVNPPYDHMVDPYAYPPVNLGYLAAIVDQKCSWVECSLLNLAGYTLEAAAECLKDYDICGYTATSPYYQSTLKLARMTARPGIRQIIGGVHVTVTNDRDPIFDAVFVGEGELSLVRYLTEIHESRPTSKVYRAEKTDINGLPFPLYTPGHKLNYAGSSKTAVVFGSRGCPHRCSFCATREANGPVRFRSVDNIVAELRRLASQGVTSVRFMDDCFLARKSQALELCQQIEDLGLTWGCLVRANHHDPRLFEAMRRAGCTDVGVGVESFDDHVLDVLNKQVTVRMIEECIRALGDANLAVRVLLMASTPGETYRQTIDLNIEYLERLKFYRLILSTFMPFPGCDIRENPSKYGVTIVEPDYSKYFFHLYQKIDAEVKLASLWSPIRIDGMTYDQQLENLARMREYVDHSKEVNRGIFK